MVLSYRLQVATMSIIKRKDSPYWIYDIKLSPKVVKEHNYSTNRYRGSTKTTDKNRALLIESKKRFELIGEPHKPVKTVSHIGVDKGAKMTLEGCLLLCLDEVWSEHKAFDSFYKPVINAISTDSIGQTPINKLTTNALNDWIQEKLKTNVRSTVNQKLGLVRNCLERAAYVWELELPKVYWKGLKLRKASRRHVLWFTVDEEQRIHDYFLSNDRQDIVDFLIVLCDVGSRVTKTLTIGINQIDFERRTVKLIDDKNGTDYIVPLTSRAFSVIQKYRHKATVFTPLSYAAVSCAWKRMRLKFGQVSGEGYKLHAFRHTCGTRLGQAGVDIKVIQQWLNHSDIRQTERYTHIVLEQLEIARDKLEGKI